METAGRARSVRVLSPSSLRRRAKPATWQSWAHARGHTDTQLASKETDVGTFGPILEFFAYAPIQPIQYLHIGWGHDLGGDRNRHPNGVVYPRAEERRTIKLRALLHAVFL